MNFVLGALLFLAAAAAARDILGKTIAFHADGACGGATVFESQSYPGFCINIPAPGACENAAFCAGRGGFTTKWQHALAANCTAFSGSVRFGEYAFSYTYDAPNCTGAATVLPRDVTCIAYPMCGATHVDVSALQASASPIQVASAAAQTWAAFL